MRRRKCRTCDDETSICTGRRGGGRWSTRLVPIQLANEVPSPQAFPAGEAYANKKIFLVNAKIRGHTKYGCSGSEIRQVVAPLSFGKIVWPAARLQATKDIDCLQARGTCLLMYLHYRRRIRAGCSNRNERRIACIRLILSVQIRHGRAMPGAYRSSFDTYSRSSVSLCRDTYCRGE